MKTFQAKLFGWVAILSQVIWGKHIGRSGRAGVAELAGPQQNGTSTGEKTSPTKIEQKAALDEQLPRGVHAGTSPTQTLYHVLSGRKGRNCKKVWLVLTQKPASRLATASAISSVTSFIKRTPPPAQPSMRRHGNVYMQGTQGIWCVLLPRELL